LALRKGTEKKETLPTSVRVTPTCRQLWDELARQMGLSNAGVLEVIIRDRARVEGITLTKPEDSSSPAA
jgi:hypothetical protein